MRRLIIKLAAVVAILLTISTVSAQTSRKSVEQKIKELRSIIKACDKRGIDTRREEVAIHTAEIFLDYADWDEENMDQSLEVIKISRTPEYSQNAEKYAALLPQFERQECYDMIVEAIETAKLVRDGKIKRNRHLTQDWTKLDIEGHQIVDEHGRAVFLSDYNFMPRISRYTDWYGRIQGFHADFFLLDEELNVDAEALESIEGDEPSNLGYVHMSHNSTKWIFDKYPDYLANKYSFMKYDIDNPLTWIYWDKILSEVAPRLAGKSRIKLGYCMANEPWWTTARQPWSTPAEEVATAPINQNLIPPSKYTIAKFKRYLKELHGDIATLNSLWRSDYSSFEEVEIVVPLDNALFGTPIWYDWMRFNQVRGAEFFTTLLATIRKYDPDAYAHVKVIPKVWFYDARDVGLDYEAITELSTIIGNDAGVNKKLAWGGKEPWEDDYAYYWNKMTMCYDFFRSIDPNKPNINTEAHYTMCDGFQDFYTTHQFVRSSMWLSTIFGSSLHASWTWSRTDDGEGNLGLVNTTKTSHIGSFGMLPRSVNEIEQMMMDLNENSEDIVALQNVSQPVRILYSESSAINKRDHMSQLSQFYESLFFNGYNLGFVTERILNRQDCDPWDVVLVAHTEYVKASELKALQGYLDRGGVVVVDSKSLKYNEYQQPHPSSLALKKSKGVLIECRGDDEFASYVDKYMDKSEVLPLSISQDLNENGKKCVYARIAQSGDDRYVLSISNLGKECQKVTINLSDELKDAECRDILTGVDIPLTFNIDSEETLFYEVVL